MHKKYKEQYKRMKRWYERFNMINRGTSISESFDYYKDNTYAFFINCYHLKDWILYDSSLYKPSSTEKEFKKESKKMEEDAKKFIKESKYLKICQDLCNGNKHLRLTRPASDANTKIGMINVKMESNNKSSKIKTRINFVVRVKNKNIDAFELASKCIKE